MAQSVRVQHADVSLTHNVTHTTCIRACRRLRSCGPSSRPSPRVTTGPLPSAAAAAAAAPSASPNASRGDSIDNASAGGSVRNAPPSSDMNLALKSDTNGLSQPSSVLLLPPVLPPRTSGCSRAASITTVCSPVVSLALWRRYSGAKPARHQKLSSC